MTEVNHPEKIRVKALVTRMKPEITQWAKNVFAERFEIRFDDDVTISIAMNEKIAGVCFPNLGRRIDYNSGFVSSDPDFHRWCHDLYSSLWEKSKRSS